MYDLKCYVKSINKIIKPKFINLKEKYISVAKKGRSNCLGYLSEVYQFSDVVFLEFTGKKDKKNEKIYRDDILLIKLEFDGEVVEETGVVVFENYCWKLRLNGYSLEFGEIDKQSFEKVEKIGNLNIKEN